MSTFKKAKVVMLPTNQKTDGMICKDITGQDKIIAIKTKYLMAHEDYIGHHLYIISDDEIKEGDWCLKFSDLYKNGCVLHKYSTVDKFFPDITFKKIIATTDTLLIIKSESPKGIFWDNTLPQPSQQFIEKFIEEYNKGNVITDVLIEYELISNEEYFGNTINPDDDVPYFDERLKINSKDNTITIKKVKDSYTREEVDRMLDEQASRTTAEMLEKFKDYKSREEVIELCKQAFIDGTYAGGFGPNEKTIDSETEKWIKENL